MTVVLFDHDAGGEPDQRPIVGEDADDVGAPSDLAVDALEWIGRAQLRPVIAREAVESEQVLLGLLEQRRDLRERLAQPLEGLADELTGSLTALGVEERAEQGGQHRLLLAAGMAERLAQEVH
jgi:hypothetical protein